MPLCCPEEPGELSWQRCRAAQHPALSWTRCQCRKQEQGRQAETEAESGLSGTGWRRMGAAPKRGTSTQQERAHSFLSLFSSHFSCFPALTSCCFSSWFYLAGQEKPLHICCHLKLL